MSIQGQTTHHRAARLSVRSPRSGHRRSAPCCCPAELPCVLARPLASPPSTSTCSCPKTAPRRTARSSRCCRPRPGPDHWRRCSPATASRCVPTAATSSSRR
jgi:hypothetical protein